MRARSLTLVRMLYHSNSYSKLAGYKVLAQNTNKMDIQIYHSFIWQFHCRILLMVFSLAMVRYRFFTHTMRCIPSIPAHEHAHNKHKYGDAKYLHLHITGAIALFKQYTNIDGHISQKVFNNKLFDDLWLSICHSTMHKITDLTLYNEIDTQTRWNALIDFYYLWLNQIRNIRTQQNLFYYYCMRHQPSVMCIYTFAI